MLEKAGALKELLRQRPFFLNALSLRYISVYFKRKLIKEILWISWLFFRSSSLWARDLHPCTLRWNRYRLRRRVSPGPLSRHETGQHPLGRYPDYCFCHRSNFCCAVSRALQYLVYIAEKILYKNPKYINYLAPVVTYVLTIFAGTGHTAFSMIPVIVEVAKGENIRPFVQLSIAVVASQIVITASPVSAAVIYMTGVLEPFGWSYPELLGIWILTTFLGCMITSFIMTHISKMDLSSDPIYQERLKEGLVKPPVGLQDMKITSSAKLSVWIFLIGVLCVVFYASAISPAVGLIKPVIVSRDAAIMSLMLAVDALITIFCKVKLGDIAENSVFKSGMVACICVLGVAWLGDTFVSGHTK